MKSTLDNGNNNHAKIDPSVHYETKSRLISSPILTNKSMHPLHSVGYLGSAI